MDVSLIVTTYNRPDALGLTLDSILSQALQPQQVVVADDGSTSDTARTVEAHLRTSGLNWVHVRHADRSIRQARIKNLGVKFASGAYLIFIDHDVPLHPRFVADHLVHAEQGCFLQGKRVFLPQQTTQKLLASGRFTPPSPFSAGLGNRKNGFRLLFFGKRLIRPKRFQTALRGCNFSLFKSDFMKVDGFDETFDGLWGREDSDICFRLFHSGIRIKNLWFCAIQYHLHHLAVKNRAQDRLDRELALIRREKRTRAVHGYSSLSAEGEIVASS